MEKRNSQIFMNFKLTPFQFILSEGMKNDIICKRVEENSVLFYDCMIIHFAGISMI